MYFQLDFVNVRISNLCSYPTTKYSHLSISIHFDKPFVILIAIFGVVEAFAIGTKLPLSSYH